MLINPTESLRLLSALQDGGRKWEKEALGGANLFMRLVEAPKDVLFSYISKIQELQELQQQTFSHILTHFDTF